MSAVNIIDSLIKVSSASSSTDCNIKPQVTLSHIMTDKKTWTNMETPPFRNKNCARPPVLVNGEIILSPPRDNNIYKFNTETESWIRNKYSFEEYKSISGHAICVSNDKKTLFLFDGYVAKILLIIDIESMKVIKKIEIDYMIKTGSYPCIIAENNLLHVIGGSWNKKHYTINIETGETNIVYTFGRPMTGGGILNSKNKIYFFHGKIGFFSFCLVTRKWTDLKIKIPNIDGFGFCLNSNEKYFEEIKKIFSVYIGVDMAQIVIEYCEKKFDIVLFGGFNWHRYKYSSDILICDIEEKTVKKSNVKTPTDGVWINIILINTVDIHLFQRDKHYKTLLTELYDETEDDI